MSVSVFVELSVVILITVFIAGVMGVLRQPLLIGYILAGILVGPNVLDVVQSAEAFETFSHMGIALLLFTVGLNLNPKVIKDIGKVSVIVGLGQIVITAAVTYLITSFLGFGTTASLYIAIALTFSSTIIILKLLSDKGDLDTLYGKISIGVLIVQDVMVVLIMLIISAIGSGQNIKTIATQTIPQGAALIVALIFITIYLFPRINRAIVKSQEFLLLFSIGWCFVVASLFDYFGFSLEVGALIAGITLSVSPYHYEISAKMRPLRDFFIVLFFIMLGSQIIFGEVLNHLLPALILSLFVIIGNPLIVLTIMGIMGYTKRTSFMTGITIGQISEFSLVMIAFGVGLGHIEHSVLSFVTLIGIISIGGSTYLVTYAERVYPLMSKYLSIFERKGKKIDDNDSALHKSHEVLLFGCNRTGYTLLHSFTKIKKKFLVIDHNPDVVERLRHQGYDAGYGDGSNLELINSIDMSKVKMIVSTIPDIEINSLLIHTVKAANEKAVIIVVSHYVDEALKLYEAGASYVIMPHLLGGSHASMLIEQHGLNLNKFLKEKVAHVEHLIERKDFDSVTKKSN